MKKIIFDSNTVCVDAIKDGDLVGIVWADGTKAILLESRAGFICLNRGLNFDISGAVSQATKQEYLLKVSADLKGQPLLFSTEVEILEWFSK